MKKGKYSNVFFRLKRLDKLIARSLGLSAKDLADKHDVEIVPTRSQMEILHYIVEHMDDEIYQKDLEQILNLRRATISGILDTMERNGLINRVIDEKDTRTKKIIMTPNAKNAYQEGEKHMENLERKAIEGISKDDIQVFYNVMDQMEENLTKQINGGTI